MKLLVLSYEYPPVGGGGGVICKYISEGLAKCGHQITLITAWLKELPEAEQTGNLKIIRLRSSRNNDYRSNPFEMISWIIKSKKYLDVLCNVEKFDLCFAHFVMPGGETAKYLRQKYNIPFVVMSHGHDVPWVRPGSLYFYHALLYFRLKKICSLSLINFIQTSEMKANIDRFTGDKTKDKNILVPNGCDINAYKPETRIKNDVMNIIFSGRLVKQKDPFTLLRAIKIFSKITRNFKIHIYGDGPLRRRLEHFIVKAALEENIIIHGKVTGTVMQEAYVNADLLVSSSISEGMSITILEAMSAGVYVILTPASGNTELITPGIDGELFDFSDSPGLAEKIRMFYNKKFLQEYSIPPAHLAEFRKTHNWEGIIKQYNTIINSVKLS